MKYFDQKNKRLVFIGKKATPEFWDNQWDIADFKKAVESGENERFVSKITSQYISPSKEKKILEGGCGKGNFVYSLFCKGYSAIGVDFAKQTVKKINTVMPSLNVTVADVRKLPFEENSFDGYWSLGVIEHFYAGYEEIAKEMHRVIKPGGYLFLTFPYMSPLRKLKAKLGLYPTLKNPEVEPIGFYQYALNHKKVVQYFENLGFKCLKQKPFEGFKGTKEESFPLLKSILQKIYNNKSFICKIIDFGLSHGLAPTNGHAVLLILKKKQL